MPQATHLLLAQRAFVSHTPAPPLPAAQQLYPTEPQRSQRPPLQMVLGAVQLPAPAPEEQQARPAAPHEPHAPAAQVPPPRPAHVPPSPMQMPATQQPPPLQPLPAQQANPGSPQAGPASALLIKPPSMLAVPKAPPFPETIPPWPLPPALLTPP
jgi:hypothetical protein